jgi:hypothetical protein
MLAPAVVGEIGGCHGGRAAGCSAPALGVTALLLRRWRNGEEAAAGERSQRRADPLADRVVLARH